LKRNSKIVDISADGRWILESAPDSDPKRKKGLAEFVCAECNNWKAETGMNLCRRRDLGGVAGLRVYQVCCTCYVKNQDKYLNDNPAPGLSMAASSMGIRLKEI